MNSPRARRFKVRKQLSDEVRRHLGPTGPFAHVRVWFDGEMMHVSAASVLRRVTEVKGDFFLLRYGQHSMWFPQRRVL